MTKIRVLIADDHAVVREGARQILAGELDIDVIGIAENGDDALAKVKATQPDVIVLDISMPGVNGLDLVPLIKRAVPATEIVVLSIHQKEAFVHQALSHGARAYVLKTAPIGDLLDAIRTAYRKEFYLSKKIEREIISAYAAKHDAAPHAPDYDSLSEREQMVFRMVVQGKSSKQIGDLLCLSPRTIEKYRASISQKLKFKDPLERLKYAIKLGLVDLEDAES